MENMTFAVPTFAVELYTHYFTLKIVYLITGMINSHTQHCVRVRAVSEVSEHLLSYCRKVAAKVRAAKFMLPLLIIKTASK